MMQHHLSRITLAGAVISTLIFVAGCKAPGAADRRAALEQAITAEAGVVKIPVGKGRFQNDTISRLTQAEKIGLVTIRHVRESYWNDFLTRTQGLGDPIEVTPTSKLLHVCKSPEGSPIPNTAVRLVSVQVSEDHIDAITTDDDYTGPLSTPGEKFRIVLGTYRDDPTAAAAVVGSLATQQTLRRKFRSILKYDQFAKRWNVVAFDVGLLETDGWLTARVK